MLGSDRLVLRRLLIVAAICGSLVIAPAAASADEGLDAADATTTSEVAEPVAPAPDQATTPPPAVDQSTPAAAPVEQAPPVSPAVEPAGKPVTPAGGATDQVVDADVTAGRRPRDGTLPRLLAVGRGERGAAQTTGRARGGAAGGGEAASVTTAPVSQRRELARTGLDAWQMALAGMACLLTGLVLMRRVPDKEAAPRL